MPAGRIRLVRRREIDACLATVLVRNSHFRLGDFCRSRSPTLKSVSDEYGPDKGLVDHILPTLYCIAFTNARKINGTNLRRLRGMRMVLNISSTAHDYAFDG